MKSGIRTTEFWVTISTIFVGIAAELKEVIPQPWGLILSTVSAGLYTISRGIAKSNEPFREDKNSGNS